MTPFMSDYKDVLRVTSPMLFALYSAGWRSGFTVNGIEAASF